MTPEMHHTSHLPHRISLHRKIPNLLPNHPYLDTLKFAGNISINATKSSSLYSNFSIVIDCIM